MVVGPYVTSVGLKKNCINILNHTLSFTINMNAQNLIWTNMELLLFQDLQH